MLCHSQLHSTLVRHGSSSALCAHLSPLRHNRVVVIATPAAAIKCITIDFHFPVHQLHLSPGCYVKNILIRYNVIRKPPQEQLQERMPPRTFHRSFHHQPVGQFSLWPHQNTSKIIFLSKRVVLLYFFNFVILHSFTYFQRGHWFLSRSF